MQSTSFIQRNSSRTIHVCGWETSAQAWSSSEIIRSRRPLMGLSDSRYFGRCPSRSTPCRCLLSSVENQSAMENRFSVLVWCQRAATVSRRDALVAMVVKTDGKWMVSLR